MNRLALLLVVMAIVVGGFGLKDLLSTSGSPNGSMVYLLLGAAGAVFLTDLVRGGRR